MVHSFFLSGFCISFGPVEPLGIFALSGRTDPGMPTSTRQQAEKEERAAMVVALGEAQGLEGMCTGDSLKSIPRHSVLRRDRGWGEVVVLQDEDIEGKLV